MDADEALCPQNYLHIFKQVTKELSPPDRVSSSTTHESPSKTFLLHLFYARPGMHSVAGRRQNLRVLLLTEKYTNSITVCDKASSSNDPRYDAIRGCNADFQVPDGANLQLAR